LTELEQAFDCVQELLETIAEMNDLEYDIMKAVPVRNIQMCWDDYRYSITINLDKDEPMEYKKSTILIADLQRGKCRFVDPNYLREEIMNNTILEVD